jgi:Protein of unknown function (DUF2892)
MAFHTSGFARFMTSAAGRWLRIIAGAALVFWGWSMHSGTGTIVIVVGLVPIAAGVFDFCLIAPILHAPFWGRQIRANDNTPS